MAVNKVDFKRVIYYIPRARGTKSGTDSLTYCVIMMT